jgi:hypothetical protein
MKKVISIVLSLVIAITCCFTSMASEANDTYEFNGFNDSGLYEYLENEIYQSLIDEFGDGDYFIENVNATYISEEYLEEVAYNSKANIYFGYNLSDVEAMFEGTKYVFCLGEDGDTTVKGFEEYDDTFDQVLRNVAIGSGVILICVTVSVVTAGTGAVAVSAIFAAAAQAGTIQAVTGGTFAGVAAGVITGIETGDVDEALKSAALAGSEGFKWGAISGAIAGGVNEGTAIYGAAKQTSFTMNQYVQIQKETGYPLDVIKQFHTMDEYQAFRDANLKPAFVNNKTALIKTEIDLTRVDSKGRTNLKRMNEGLAPLDANGESYELHHVGQKKDGTLAILTRAEHDNPTIHGFLEKTEAHAVGTNWDKERREFWKAFAEMIG